MLGEYKGISVRVLVKVRNMTAGSPLKHILGIAMPLMLGNICQQLYTVVDASIVGKGIGVEALAALGASDWFHWLFLGIVQGFAQGFAIPMAQAFGAEDHGELRRYLGSSILLAAASAAFVTGVALLSIRPVLELLSTPMDIRPMAISYLTVLFSGIPMVMAYNLMASLLRALGDGRTPLFAILMAACINIGLDILFVIGLGWGVASAAAATLFAQGCSSFFCLARLKRISFLRLSKEDLKPEAARCRRMMGIGLPISLQNTVIAVGGMILQRFANPMGVSFIAGYTATNKLYGLLEVASLSYGYAMSTYVGQNLGARKIQRIPARRTDGGDPWGAHLSCNRPVHDPLWAKHREPVHRPESAGGGGGRTHRLRIPDHHGLLSAHPLFVVQLQIQPAGHGAHVHPHAVRGGGVHHAGRHRAVADPLAGLPRPVLGRGVLLGGRGGYFISRVFECHAADVV